MSKSTRNTRAQQRPTARGVTAPEAALELITGEEGTWIICGHHTPTGRRVVFLVGAIVNGDGALAVARETAAQLDPFTGPDAWEFSVEMYDVDAVIATHNADLADQNEPIGYVPTELADTEIPDLLDSDLELTEPHEDLFWPERAAAGRP